MRQQLAVCAVSAVMLTVAACSGGDDTGDDKTDSDKPTSAEAVKFVQKSAAATLDTSSFDIEYDFNLVLGAQNLTLSVDGIVDYENVVADLEFVTVKQGNRSQASLKADGQNVWISQSGVVPQGKWAEGDVAEIKNATTFNTDGLLGFLYMLRGAEEVTVGAASEVDGVSGREYTTTISYREAVIAAGSDAPAFQRSFSLTGAAATADLDVTVWIADEDSIVRDLSFDVTNEGSAFGATGDGNLQLRDVGDELDSPEPPPASATITGAEADLLFSQLIK